MKQSFEIRTERLLIRSLCTEDTEQLASIWSDAEVTRYMGGPRDYKETLADLVSEAAEGNIDPADALFPTIERTSGRVIGHCGLLSKEVDGKPETELIYVFARSEWGRGFATEAALALCTFAFEELGLQRLIALIDPDNRGSARVAEKVDMKFRTETIRPSGKRMQLYLRESG